MTQDFGDTIFPKASKDHRCEWCGDKILKGETHAKFTGVWEGEFQNWRMHSECITAADDTDALAEGFTPYEYTRGTACERSE